MTPPAIPIIAVLTVAAWWSFAIAWADIRVGQNQLEAALAAAPDKAEYLSRLATPASLNRATELNPWDSSSWVELGLLAERDQNYSQAEALLLRAAHVDRQYQPRWSLANFYFRRQAGPAFWTWAKKTIALAHTDPLPIFHLCGRMDEDGLLIDRVSIQDPSMQAAYFDYLLGQNRPDLLQPAIRHVLENGRTADVPLLMQAAEQILGARRDAEAIQLWRRLALQSMLPWPADDSTNLLSNSKFSAKPTGQAFDWRLVHSDGVDFSLHQGLDIDFTGEQPEPIQLLTQVVPSGGGVKYELKSDYHAPNLNGLAWYILDARTGRFLQSGDINSRLTFETPPHCRLVDIALRYYRPIGSTRIKGTLTLQSVTLRKL